VGTCKEGKVYATTIIAVHQGGGQIPTQSFLYTRQVSTQEKGKTNADWQA